MDTDGRLLMVHLTSADISYGWTTRWRRLVRDYEAYIDVSQAMILVAMGGNLLRRTTQPCLSKRTLRGGFGMD